MKTLTSRFIQAIVPTLLISSAVFISQVMIADKGLAQDALPDSTLDGAEDRLAEADRLLEQGGQQLDANQLPQALESLEMALELYQDLGNRAGEGRVYRTLGNVEWMRGNADDAREYQQRALAIARDIGDSDLEGKALNNLGLIAQKSGQIDDAIELYQQALQVVRDGDHPDVAIIVLGNLGNVYIELNEYSEAIDYYQQLLVLAQSLDKIPQEVAALTQLGVAYRALEDHETAVRYLEQALATVNVLENPQFEGSILVLYVQSLLSLNQTQEAFDAAQQLIVVGQQTNNRPWQGVAYFFLSLIEVSRGNLTQANNFAQQSFQFIEANEKSLGTFAALALGFAQAADTPEEYQLAITYANHSLQLSQDLENPGIECLSHLTLAIANSGLNEMQRAINAAETCLTISQQTGDAQVQTVGVMLLSLIYTYLGEYEAGLRYLQTGIEVAVAQENAEAAFLFSVFLAVNYHLNDQSDEAVNLMEELLAAVFTNPDDNSANYGSMRGVLGMMQTGAGEYQQAADSLRRSLAIAQNTENKDSEETAWAWLGNVYSQTGRTEDAIIAYQNALLIDEEANNLASLLGLGRIYRRLGLPAVAITYYKQAINRFEEQRLALSGLNPDLQNSFLNNAAFNLGDKRSNVYRELADLLLAEGRIPEAQQVLELLKVEELQEFTRSRVSADDLKTLELTPIEKDIIDEYGSLVAFGEQLPTCQRENCEDLDTLIAQRRTLISEFNQKMQSIEAEIRERRAVDDAFLDPRNLSTGARQIVEAQPGTLLVYPFVLEDKLWLLWAAPNGIANTIEVPVTRQELGETVLRFGELLRRPDMETLPELQATGQQLYEWLIQPLESEIEQNNITNLIFALDRVTRYIPMAALHDGEQYLIEQFSVSTIISAGETDVGDRLNTDASVLALGVSEAISPFSALPNVPIEIDTIVREAANDEYGIFPGSKLLNQEFTFDALETSLFGHQVLHIATHGEFVPGVPDDSYLLLGNGDPLTIPQINTLYDLSGYDMVVLSACETALGGPDKDGIEIVGLAHYFLADNRADTVIASLWKVSDTSTSLLMQEFYANLSDANAPMTRSEALRTAQLALLNGGESIVSSIDRGVRIEDDGSGEPLEIFNARDRAEELQHPYYWAPFILIGNGL